ncbi:MAG: calcium-binding protein [Planktothrix sp.]|uniref:calcium-binding protein n=1 Tax=Planktothrix sp. TaxID=3088171 RepID=UPI0038D3F094
MFNKIINIVSNIVWPVAKPVIFTFFPQYEPLFNTILPIAEPWIDKLLEQNPQITLKTAPTLEVKPSQILSDINILSSYKTLTQLSGQSSQLFILTDDSDILAPVNDFNLPQPPTGMILPEWTMNNPGGILALAGDDILVGSEQTDVMNGNTGNDQLSGAESIDLLRGGQGNDTLKGDSGNDIINGNRDDDFLIGGDGEDLLRGGKGKDHLDGGSGQDILIGDLEFDILTGGADADIFILSANAAEVPLKVTEADLITDFNATEGDKIMIIANSLTSEELTLETFDQTANLQLATGSSQGVIIRQTTTGNIFGVVANTTDINSVKNSISIVNISDALLGIG